jgi:hypothetical protein
VNVVRAIILALVGSAAAAIAFGAEPRSTGVVTGLVAEFSIPVAHEGPWRWARAKTRDNVLEFMWDLSVKSSDGEYQFGFSLFKFPGAAEGAGNLDELLRAGQASLWKIGPDGGCSLVEGAMVSATAGRRPRSDQAVRSGIGAFAIRRSAGGGQGLDEDPRQFAGVA